MSPEKSFLIRMARPEDVSVIRQIAAETAAEQNPIVQVIGDPDFIGHVLTAGYIELEPELLFVAVDDDRVVGYLTGAANSQAFVRRYLLKVFPSVAWRFFSRGIFLKLKIYSYFARSIWQSFRNSTKRNSAIQDYPAHCHLNLIGSHRKFGLGSQLMSRFLEELQRRNIHGVHLATITEAGKGFFKKCGFKTAVSLQTPGYPAGCLEEMWVMVLKI